MASLDPAAPVFEPGPSPRIMIVAGEASGDLHGAGLVRAVKRLAPGTEFFGMGGRRLQEAGVNLVFDLERMSMMGLVEIVTKLGVVWETIKTLRQKITLEKPDALVLIDYPEINFRLAKTARKAGVPVIYFICPQIWAWRTGRVRRMAQWIDRRVVVFPFEVAFYEKHGLSADFVGHPLMDLMAPPRPKVEVKAELGFDPDRPLLLLLPGSRKHLVETLLPVMLEAAGLLREKRPDLAVAVARADTMKPEFIEGFLDGSLKDVTVLGGRSHQLQNAADLALAASGTSNLETALNLTPMVVTYRVHYVSYLLARMLVKTTHVSMPNLIAGTEVVPEMLQDDCRADRLADRLARILDDPAVGRDMIDGLRRVRERLGGPGAFDRTARIILETVGRTPAVERE